MNKPIIYSTLDLPEASKILGKTCKVVSYKGRGHPTRKEIIKNIAGRDALLCSLSDSIDKDVIDASDKLKVISSYSVGYNHIDIDSANRRGIPVTYTPEVLTETTADLAFGLMLAVARRIPESDNYVRRGKWRYGWRHDLMLGRDVNGKILGILGMGRIGSAVARRARGFGMKIIYHNSNRLAEEEESELDATYRSFEDLLAESDYVSIHLPLTEDTYHMLNESTIRKMKPSSYVINTARGAVIDEKALVKALREKWIAGAALDVFEKEPLARNSKLMKMRNLVIVPHIGSASIETRKKMAEIAANSILDVLYGRKPQYVVNPQTLESG